MGSLNDIVVVDVCENEEVLHITKEPLKVGESIEGKIQWEERFDKMQQHTAEHIVSGIINARYGFHNVGFHLNREIVTMDFDGVITREQGDMLEKEVNDAVAMNIPVQVLYPSKSELDTLEYRSKIEIEGQVRIVEIAGYDSCACCAPHVKATGEIGMVKLTDIQSHRGGVRITMLCGKRALRDYQLKSRNVKNISKLLSAKEEEVAVAVERLKEESHYSKLENYKLQKLLVDYKLREVTEDKEIMILFENDLQVDSIRELVNGLVEKDVRIVAVFFGNEQEGYRYIIGSGVEDVRIIGKELNTLCHGRGGGKPAMIQGSVAATKEDILAVFAEMS